MDKLFLDIETNGTDGRTGDLLLVGYALNDGPVEQLMPGDWGAPTEPFIDLVNTLKDPNVGTVSHSIFDEDFQLKWGVSVNGPVYDTKVMAWVLNENTPLDIDWLAHRYANINMDKRLVRSGGHIYFRADDDQLYDLAEWREWAQPMFDSEVWAQFEAYNIRDVEALRKLYDELHFRLEESQWIPYWEREEVPYTRVLLDMQQRGMPIDLEATAVLAEQEAEVKDRTERELKDEAGLPESFNLNSQVQLNAYLFGRVAKLYDELRLGADAVACVKSCLDGEHEDCDPGDPPGGPSGPATAPPDSSWHGPIHIVDLLPENFTIEKVGREVIHGYYTVKGRGLRPTPKPVNKLTGEEGKLPSTSSPELLYMHASDPWVRKLCMEYRKSEKLLTTYLTKFPRIAVNERGETLERALSNLRGVMPEEVLHEAARRLGSPQGERVESRWQQPELPIHTVARAPAGGQQGIRASTHMGSGEETRPLSSAVRSGASLERGWNGQQSEQLAGSAEISEPLVASAIHELGQFRIFGRFNQTGTVTGRLSSNDPNLQNMPARGERGKKVRQLFTFSNDHRLVIADYDQLELRIMASLSGDPRLVEVFVNGDDPHEMLAHAIFGDVDVRAIAPGAAASYRDAAKNLNYAMGYGAGPRKIAQTLSLLGFPTTKDVAAGYLAEMERFYRVLFQYNQRVKDEARRKGSVRTLGGRRRRLRGQFRDTANWKAVGYGERQAVNAIIQGTAADIIRRAMIDLEEWGQLPMLAQVHDELVFESYGMPSQTTLDVVQTVGQTAHGLNLSVPLVFEPHVGKSWAAKSGPELSELLLADTEED